MTAVKNFLSCNVVDWEQLQIAKNVRLSNESVQDACNNICQIDYTQISCIHLDEHLLLCNLLMSPVNIYILHEYHFEKWKQ